MDVAPRVTAKLRELPEEPGVYQMKDKRGKIIYVGKALNLKNRVTTYFQAGAENDRRIRYLVRKIEDVDWIVVPTELDALMLESSLIRQFKPYYNTSLKDDKSYPYIKITTNEAYPRVMLTRRYLNDGGKYWGPMTNVRQVRSAVRFIAGLFQLRTCKLELDGKKFVQKPCLDYHLKLCSAPCVNYIDREEYRKLVRFAVDFFNGNYGRVVAELKRRMTESAAGKEYEAAARYRDLIAAAEKSFDRTRVIGRPEENMDVIGVARSEARACVLVMPVRDGRLVGDRKYILDHRMEDDEDVLSNFIKLHYANPLNVPKELVLPWEPTDCDVLQQWLGRLYAQAERETESIDRAVGVAPARHSRKKGKETEGALSSSSVDGQETEKSGGIEEGRAGATPTVKSNTIVKFNVTPKGHKREIVEIAMRNASERLHTDLLESPEEFVISDGQRALFEHLRMLEMPRRVEGYDIANLHGKEATGAMVVSIGGRRAPREYRLFNIRLKQTPDDFAMLRETLIRRLNRLVGDPKWDTDVELIMIDGGKGQLSAAKDAVNALLADPTLSVEQKDKVERIKLCSLAKQEELVYHYAEDGSVEELRLERTDPGLRLLVDLRNEAHRYGNLQHQRLRDKKMKLSVLDTIPGVGEIKTRALLQHFGTVKALREASIEELAQVPGVSVVLAKQVRRYLDRDAELEEGKNVLRREMKFRSIRRHDGLTGGD
jgi:excinuclease ABC subunit C